MENPSTDLMIFPKKTTPLSSGISQLPMFEDTDFGPQFLAPVSASHTRTVPSKDVVRYLSAAKPLVADQPQVARGSEIDHEPSTDLKDSPSDFVKMTLLCSSMFMFLCANSIKTRVSNLLPIHRNYGKGPAIELLK